MTEPALLACTRIIPDMLVLATSAGLAPLLIPIFPAARPVFNLSELRHVIDGQPGRVLRLVCIGFGAIVPAGMLARFAAGAFNLHPAPPEYPGSAANHRALYEGANSFGITAHLMTAAVDAGPILTVDRFAIPAGIGHRGLDLLTLPALLSMAARLAPCLTGLADWAAPVSEHWRGPARRRADVLKLAQVTEDLSPEEAHRRWRAFHDGPDSILTYWQGGVPQPYRPKGRILGWVDGVIDGALQGWAFDAGRGPARLWVEIDGQPAIQLTAIAMRGDVAAAGHGDGRCGFHVSLADLNAWGRQVDFLLPDDEWRRLPGGPVRIGETV